jgi:hypothetical protein
MQQSLVRCTLSFNFIHLEARRLHQCSHFLRNMSLLEPRLYFTIQCVAMR